jgi:hypothetical protein
VNEVFLEHGTDNDGVPAEPAAMVGRDNEAFSRRRHVFESVHFKPVIGLRDGRYEIDEVSVKCQKNISGLKKDLHLSPAASLRNFARIN